MNFACLQVSICDQLLTPAIDEIQNQRQDNTQNNTCCYGEIEPKVAFLNGNIARESPNERNAVTVSDNYAHHDKNKSDYDK